LGLLEQAVDRVAKLEVDQVSDGCLGDELVRLRRSIDRLEAEFSRRLQRFERLRGHVAGGAASLVAWLRENCRLSLRGAATRAGVARSLASLPGAEELFNTGAIGFRHAAVLAQAVAEIGEEPVAQAGDILLEAARRLDPDRLRLLTKHLRHCVDPDGALDQTRRDYERRRLHVSAILDGMCVVNGLLDAEGGALLRTALEALMRPLPDDQRNAAQRRADALVELARRQLQSGDLPAMGGERPHLMITSELGTLAGLRPAPAAELRWHGTLPAESVRRIACDAAVVAAAIPAVTGPRSGPTRITYGTGPMAATQALTTWCSCAGCITVTSMRAAEAPESPGWCRLRRALHELRDVSETPALEVVC
ncbi:MAG: DUF222 domain-containing protein, partial [Chloroflexi bacterium]